MAWSSFGKHPSSAAARRTMRESGLRPRPNAVPSVSSYVARPSIIHDIASEFGKRNGARPKR